MNRAVLGWCRLYTVTVPAEVRERRRDEIAAHVWDALSAGRRRRDVAIAALLGVVDDVRWCGDERRRAGLAPVVFGTAGSSAIAVALMAFTFLLSADPHDRFDWSGEVLPQIAAVVVVVSLLDRARRWITRWRG